MDILRKTKDKLKHYRHFSLHVPNVHSSCDAEFDLAEDPTPLLLGHEYYPFKTTLPVPLGSPATVDKPVLNGIDPAFDIVHEKHKYKQKYQTFLQQYHNIPVPGTVESLQSTSVPSMIQVHPNLALLAQLVSEDPHPHLDGEYNSYYGNVVTVCSIQGDDLLIYPAPYSLDKLKVLHLNNGSEPGCVSKECLVDHGIVNPEPIYQIQSAGNIVLLRMSNKCVLFRISSVDGEVLLQSLYADEIKDPFITSCLSSYKNEFATLTPNALLKVHDTSNSRINCEVNLSFLETEPFWGSLHYQDEHVLMFSDRKAITLLDLRNPISRSTVLSWDVSSVTDACDSIYSSIKGAYLHYVCTNHYLLSLDIRKGWHQRWAHGLTSIPSLLSLTSKELRADSLLIGCQVGGGIVNVYNAHSKDFNFEFVKMPPFQLPSLIETLHQARLEGHCLSPMLNSRFSMSLIGLYSIRNSCNMDVFLCNSIRDLFSQQMSLIDKQESFTPKLNEQQIKRLNVWGSECLQQYIKNECEINATSIHSHQEYLQFFEPPQSSTDDYGVEPLMEVESTVQPWTWTKQDIEGCCDIVASELLPCWKLEKDDEGWLNNFKAEPKLDHHSDGESSDSSVDVNQRIQDWLEKCVQEEPIPQGNQSTDVTSS